MDNWHAEFDLSSRTLHPDSGQDIDLIEFLEDDKYRCKICGRDVDIFVVVTKKSISSERLNLDVYQFKHVPKAN